MADVVEVMAQAAFTAAHPRSVPFNEHGDRLRSRFMSYQVAVLSALDAAGYAVVPKEPTKAMRDAAMHHLLNTGNIYTREGEETIVVETYVTKAVYGAMLSASQVKP